MRLVSGLGAVLLSTLLVTGHANGQTLKDGTLTGDIHSATAQTPPGTTTTVFFVPPGRTYIMTQSCVSGILSGSVLGNVSDGGCSVFTPGIAFQPGELISLTARPPSPFPGPGDDGASALITGVLVDLETEDDD